MTPAENERLAYLAEECSEVIQIIMKIKRHGFESYHPNNPEIPNRELFFEELEDIMRAIALCCHNGDTNGKYPLFQLPSEETMKWFHFHCKDCAEIK